MKIKRKDGKGKVHRVEPVVCNGNVNGYIPWCESDSWGYFLKKYWRQTNEKVNCKHCLVAIIKDKKEKESESICS
jgi:hypothetical protein